MCASCTNQYRAYFSLSLCSAKNTSHICVCSLEFFYDWLLIYSSFWFVLYKIIGIDRDTKLNCNHFVCLFWWVRHRIGVFNRTIIFIYEKKKIIECIYVCIMLHISNQAISNVSFVVFETFKFVRRPSMSAIEQF